MTHHPGSEWLEQYAAGSLSAGQALCVAAHVSLCVECRREVAALQRVGGVLLQELGTANVADALLDNIFATIDAQPVVAALQPSAAAMDSAAMAAADADVPRPLRGLIPGGYDRLRWSRVLPALRLATLDVGDERCQVSLQRVRAGGRIAMHDHRDTELTVVLRGAFSDDCGVYRVGDFLVREPHQRHQPMATQNEECICLSALAAPVRFTGPLMRWVNRFLH